VTGIIDFRTVIEDDSGTAISEQNPFPVEIVSQGLVVLQRVASLLKPLQQVTGGGSNRLSVDVNSGNIAVSSGTITTVNTVSSITNYANVWAFDQSKAISRLAYNQGIRLRIS
jgi:hypothetical protein